MQKKQQLLERLDAIGVVLKESGTALALLGLGVNPRTLWEKLV